MKAVSPIVHHSFADFVSEIDDAMILVAERFDDLRRTGFCRIVTNDQLKVAVSLSKQRI
jgi:hypothetical protein